MRGATGRPLSPCADTLRFQSTRPLRGATVPVCDRRLCVVISIHAPHAGRDAGDKYITGSNCISIHAPLAGCDVEHIQHTVWFSPYFNPRAPCGARHKSVVIVNSAMIFQSTRPVRGATSCAITALIMTIYFNPRAPCGARRPARTYCGTRGNFNPRAPCGARRQRG